MIRVAPEPKIAAPIIMAGTLKFRVATKGMSRTSISRFTFADMMYATHNTTIAPMMTLGFLANFGIATRPPLARLERLLRRVNAAESRHRIYTPLADQREVDEHREGG